LSARCVAGRLHFQIERIKNLIVESVANGANRLERPNDPLAQFDQSGIRHALRDFPELQGEMPELMNAASEAVSTRRADIEKLAGALVERMSLNSDEVRQLIGDLTRTILILFQIRRL
jgi:hypothetical protein